MAFGQGVVVIGGLTGRSCDAMRGNHDNCSYTPPSFFVALIGTYTRVHERFASLVFRVTFPLGLSLQR